MWPSYYFNFERNFNVLKLKESIHNAEQKSEYY